MREALAHHIDERIAPACGRVLFYRDLQAIVSDQGVAQDYVQAHMWFNLAAAAKARDVGLDYSARRKASHAVGASVGDVQKFLGIYGQVMWITETARIRGFPTVGSNLDNSAASLLNRIDAG